MITVEHLTKWYGGTRAVEDLCFSIEKHGVYGFLGPNGAGKSTTLNILTGCLSPTQGTVTVCGHDILEEPKKAKGHMGYLPEQPPLYLQESPWDYLCFVGEAKGLRGQALENQVFSALSRTGTMDVCRKALGSLSKGYRQRVGIAQAILGDPDIIILDEPTVGLDPRQITEIRELIQKLGGNKTVILSSHILGEVQAVCERLLILSKGKLVACDTPANLEKQMSSASALEIDVCASTEQAEKLLSRLPNVQSFKSKGTADRCQIRLETEKEHLEDLSKAVFFALAEAGTPLLAMTPTKASLEDIFLGLTEGKEPEA